MSADPADRTATLQPTLPSDAPARERASVREPVADDEALPVDDPDRYQQVGEHARGGLGRVVRAVDRRLGRTVAVKELLRQDDWHEARFMREALITARLEHPGIVPVHEAGRWPNGAPYYVMKLVEGRTLKELFAEKPTLRDRLSLLPHVIAIADAVGYAHSEGVIHRDLKPSNVIVGEFGETIVIDWGLARDTKQDLPERTSDLLISAKGSGESPSTISGKVVGTPAYMAPEQARGELVDERADVYAIGAMIYELCAGKAPHADTTPQAMIDRVISGPPAPLCDVAPSAPGELVDIVGKAMARQPSDRYPNGSALAEDLRRFQTGKLVSAHAYTPWQLVRKKLAQHRGVVLVAAASAVALGAVGVESFRTVVAERDKARAERSRAEVLRLSAEERKRELLFVQAETSLREDPTAALAWLKLHPVTDRDRTQVVDVIDEALALGAARHVFRPGDWVFDIVYTPDGKSLIAAVRDGKLRSYDVETGTLRVIGETDGHIEALALARDGKTLYTAGAMGRISAWSLPDGKRTLIAEGGAGKCPEIQLDASGKQLVAYCDGISYVVPLDGTVTPRQQPSPKRRVFAPNDPSKHVTKIAPNQLAVESATGTRMLAEIDKNISFLALSPNGDQVILHDTAAVWMVPFAGGKLTKLLPWNAQLSGVEWSPDGKTLALVGHLHDIALVDLATGKVRELRGHTDSVYNCEFTRDGRMLVSASDDGSARVWNVADGSSLVLRGHEDDVYRARFSPDEKSVATASLDGSIRLWPIDRSGSRVLAEGDEIRDLAFVDDRIQVTTNLSVSHWDLATGAREQLYQRAPLGMGAVSPDGNWFITLGTSWTIELRHRNGTTKPLVGHKGYITGRDWSRDHKSLYTGSVDGTLRKWDLETGKSTVILEDKQPIRGIAVAADGRVAAHIGDTAVIINPDGTRAQLASGLPVCGAKAEFDRVGDRLVVQMCDTKMMLIDGERTVDLPTGGVHVSRLTVSNDGQRIAAGMGDRTVRVWDASGRLLHHFRGHTDLVMDVAFSPDGRQLASASYDRTARVWDLETGRYRVLRGHSRAVSNIEWKTATEIVTGSYDGTMRVWPVPSTSPATQQEISRRLDTATSATIDADNRATSLISSPTPSGTRRL